MGWVPAVLLGEGEGSAGAGVRPPGGRRCSLPAMNDRREATQRARATLALIEAHVGAAKLSLRKATETCPDFTLRPELRDLMSKTHAINLALLTEIQRLNTD